MRRLLPLALVGLSALLGAPGPASAEDQTVQATSDNVFRPGTVTINVGDTVTWTNSGGLGHTVTSSSDNWSKDSAIAAPGQSTSHTFEAAGRYNYFCETHGQGMRGAVLVQSPAPKPTTRPPSPRPTTPRPSGSTASRTPRPTSTPTTPESPAPSATGTVGPPVLTAAPSRSGAPAPLPTVEPSESRPPDTVEVRGLGRPAPTGRERGLPIALAVVTLGGVVTAQLRTLLAVDR